MTSAPLLQVEDVHKTFMPARRQLGRAQPPVVAVDGVTFAIEAGETLALVGESGCGKTTLGRCVARLERPDAGRILYRDRDIAQLGRRQLRPVRGEVQVVFQDAGASLNPRKSVGESIALPLRVRGNRKPEREVHDLLERVGLSAADAVRYPHQLSGGQRQRVGIARALAPGPSLIVCDEPASALDVSVQAQICNLLKDLRDAEGTAYLFISHDLALVREMADRIAVMYLGRIVEMTDVDQLFASPRHPYTHALLAAVPARPGQPRRPRLQSNLQGEPRADPTAGCAFHPRCPHATDVCRRQAPPLVPHTGGSWVACHHPARIDGNSSTSTTSLTASTKKGQE